MSTKMLIGLALVAMCALPVSAQSFTLEMDTAGGSTVPSGDVQGGGFFTVSFDDAAGYSNDATGFQNGANPNNNNGVWFPASGSTLTVQATGANQAVRIVSFEVVGYDSQQTLTTVALNRDGAVAATISGADSDAGGLGKAHNAYVTSDIGQGDAGNVGLTVTGGLGPSGNVGLDNIVIEYGSLIPEPTSIVLALCGLLGLMGIRVRRRS